MNMIKLKTKEVSAVFISYTSNAFRNFEKIALNGCSDKML